MARRAGPRRVRLEPERYADPSNVFHLVIRGLIGKRPFAGQVADAVWTALMAERDLKHIDVLAACLMPDHLHVVARPGERAIGQWLALFKSYTTGLIRNAGGPRFTWQPSYYDRLVRNELELGDTLRYVIHNPVVAGLVERPEDWPWVWWTQMG